VLGDTRSKFVFEQAYGAIGGAQSEQIKSSNVARKDNIILPGTENMPALKSQDTYGGIYFHNVEKQWREQRNQLDGFQNKMRNVISNQIHDLQNDKRTLWDQAKL